MISLLEIAQNITEADVDDDKIIKYKNKDGESKEMKASSAKKMDKEHPAKIAYDKIADKGDDSEKDSGAKLGGSDFERDGEEGDVEPVKYKVGKGIPTSDVKVDQETKDTILQDFNPPRDAERDENGLPTNEEDWDKEMTEVESMFEKARDAYEAAERDATDAAFDDDEEEAEYLSDRATQALKEYEKYKKVRDAYEEKGQELGVYVETITLNGKQYKPIKESKESNPRIFKEIYDRTFRSLK